MTPDSKKSLTQLSSLCLLSLSAGSGSVFAQGLDSHVHGAAELNIAISGQQLQVEFVSPAMNLLGFERAPNSDEETELLNSIINQLLDGGEWLLGNTFASCEASTQEFEGPVFEAASHDHEDEHDHEHEDEHDHEHEDEHDHEHDGEAVAHADFRVQYLYDCPAAPAREFRVTAFDLYSGIEEITVQWIAERQQGLAELTANNSVLVLE